MHSFYDDPDRPRTVFEAIRRLHHDEDFVPMEPSVPTDAIPGSYEKLEVLKRRVENGEPLWHDKDRTSF